MKLINAIKLARLSGERQGTEKNYFLAVGFEPLHLQTFLTARLSQHFDRDPITIKTGLYGDLATNIKLATECENTAIFVKIEWDDLDPRLGFRSLGGWDSNIHQNILDTVKKSTTRLSQDIIKAAQSAPVIMAGPNLPLAPVFLGEPTHITPQVAQLDIYLQTMLASMPSNVKVINPSLLSTTPKDCANNKSLLTTGYPYTNSFTDELSLAFASAATPTPIMKGIITDLDDTLWQGIVGDDGPENIAWDQDNNALPHGLYQQFLNSLIDAGVFVAIASKNEPNLIQTAFQRKDMIFRHQEANPKEIHWGPKSNSIARILNVWNIGSDSVTFVDDSAAELGEVKSAFTDIDCRQFPTNDPNGIINLLFELRSTFAKSEISLEDTIRAQSIRHSDKFDGEMDTSPETHETFLSELQGKLIIDWRKMRDEKRAFELLNKTNQMNLNGIRWEWSNWMSFLSHKENFQLVANYEDRFGPLGRIAVMGGRQLQNSAISIEYFVMSCRGFGRRIEHACLSSVFNRFDTQLIQFNFTATKRNQPMRTFLSKYLSTNANQNEHSMTREEFFTISPKLYLKIEDQNCDV